MIPLVLTVLSTLRLTRFITTDTLGEWWIVKGAKEWAGYHEGMAQDRLIRAYAAGSIDTTYVLRDGSTTRSPAEYVSDLHQHDPITWQAKLVSGLDCPFCVGFWLGAGVLLSGVICTALGPIPRAAWKFVTGALALNYVVGHISSRID